MTAPYITIDEFEKLSKRKKRVETTKEDNATCHTYYWQKELSMQELDANILVKFIYDANPLNNYPSLVDIKNHINEDFFKQTLSS